MGGDADGRIGVQMDWYGRIPIFLPPVTGVNVKGFSPPVVGMIHRRPEGGPPVLDEGAAQAAVVGGIAAEPPLGSGARPLILAGDPGNRVGPTGVRLGGKPADAYRQGDQRPGGGKPPPDGGGGRVIPVEKVPAKPGQAEKSV